MPERNIHELEKRLLATQERCKNAVKALAPKHKGAEMEEYKAARTSLLSAERELAEAKGEECAIPFPFPVKWDAGAPLPVLIANDYKAFLVFCVRTIDPLWDGTYVTIKDPSSCQIEKLAIVEFEHVASVKIGAPNDEAQYGHPLFGRGLEGYTAQMVKNSKWLAEIETTNKKHHNYSPEMWSKLIHYVFWFHDTTFESAAQSYKVEIVDANMAQVITIISARLL